jgi:Ca2+-binding RTX toxin-like protein
VHARTSAAAGFAVLAALGAAPVAGAHTPDPVTAEVTGTTLTVQGTDGPDSIGVALGGEDLRIEVGGRDARFPHAAVDTVVIRPGAGEDTIALGDLGDTVFEGVQIDLGGDGEADDVAVTGSPDRDFASLSHFGATTFVLGLPTFSTVVDPDVGDALTLDTAAGDDQVSAQSYPAEALGLTLAGGPGDDDLAAGRGADLLLGGPGDDFAAGGGGDDVARLGAGGDIFFWDPGEGSDAVAAQRGHDALSFEGADVPERVDVRAVGDQVRLTRDVGGIVMDLDEVERIRRSWGAARTARRSATCPEPG